MTKIKRVQNDRFKRVRMIRRKRCYKGYNRCITNGSGVDTRYKAIRYESRSLSPAEKNNYSKRECLAVHFGSVRFQMYLVGKTYVYQAPACSSNREEFAPFRKNASKMGRL